ncbi:hypothetical protein ACLQ9F_11885 [Bordetella avium]|uniref:Phage protein n=1 Tax=Bordetella avium (strain 197N) TaxID=360910 RepID=Q2L291_BORA1|nr:hypothetical protein [Bordetella avium]RIQ47779.1 hypothetical protein D0843_16610 [Bordetella avium]RIQ71051.1 hypothetical protein D0838_10025 [Bordetella avium]CAJ49088.1 phage protein [Bordetella avium 197N]
MNFKYYKDLASGEVYAYEADGSQDAHIREGLVAMTDDEVKAHLSAPPSHTVAPTSVTMRQARLALLKLGLLAQVNAAVASVPGEEGEAARIEWQFAGSVERGSELVEALSQALGWSSAQLDELFELAITL